MIVKYSGKNMVSVQNPDSLETITFVPGNNEISSAVWKKLQENKNFARRVSEGSFKVKKEEDSAEGVNPLAEMALADAKQLVRDTFDPELLRSWKETETRKTVLAVIDEQLAIPEKRMEERKKAQKKGAEEEEGEGDE